GSIFLLAGSTALGAALERPEATPLPAFLVALGYPVSDLVLVVFVVLLGTFRNPANPRALLFLGLGLVSVSVSDSLFLYLVSMGAEERPGLFGIAFVLRPVLIALPLLVPPPAATERRTDDIASERRAVLLPYLPLTATGLLLVARPMVGARIDTVERVLGLGLIALVVVRQLVTLLDNVNLLHQVRDGQEQLRQQAFNDSLTGLANRALFRDRLAHAISRHRRDGRPFALLF